MDARLSRYFIVDCEAPRGVGSPAVGDMTEFAAVHVVTLRSFHGPDCSRETFLAFRDWLHGITTEPRFVSDNPAYDWQWINYYFWKYLGGSPFGHSARRIGDFASGLQRRWHDHSSWKKLRLTEHTHDPVDDATGNAEALRALWGESGIEEEGVT